MELVEVAGAKKQGAQSVYVLTAERVDGDPELSTAAPKSAATEALEREIKLQGAPISSISTTAVDVRSQKSAEAHWKVGAEIQSARETLQRCSDMEQIIIRKKADLQSMIDTLAKCALTSSGGPTGRDFTTEDTDSLDELSGFGSPISVDGQDSLDMAICLPSNVHVSGTENGPEADMECGSEDEVDGETEMELLIKLLLVDREIKDLQLQELQSPSSRKSCLLTEKGMLINVEE